MKISKRYIGFIFLLLTLGALSQNVLVLEKGNKKRNWKYKADDRISLRLHPKGQMISGRIAYIGTDGIQLENMRTSIPIDSIKVVVRHIWGPRFFGELLVKGGIGFAIISVANNLIQGGFEPLDYGAALIISSALVAPGLLIGLLRYKSCPIDNVKWRLKLLDFTNH